LLHITSHCGDSVWKDKPVVALWRFIYCSWYHNVIHFVLQLNIVTWSEYYFCTNLWPEFERFIAVSLHKIPQSLEFFGHFDGRQFYVATILEIVRKLFLYSVAR
jgi:hypothetical protein